MSRKLISAFALSSLFMIGCGSDPGSVEPEEGLPNTAEEVTQEIEDAGISEEDYLNARGAEDGAGQ